MLNNFNRYVSSADTVSHLYFRFDVCVHIKFMYVYNEIENFHRISNAYSVFCHFYLSFEFVCFFSQNQNGLESVVFYKGPCPVLGHMAYSNETYTHGQG